MSGLSSCFERDRFRDNRGMPETKAFSVSKVNPKIGAKWRLSSAPACCRRYPEVLSQGQASFWPPRTPPFLRIQSDESPTRILAPATGPGPRPQRKILLGRPAQRGPPRQPKYPSALARNDPRLLSKSDPPKRPFGAGQARGLGGKGGRRPACGWDTKTLRAFGADETASFIPCPRARPVLRMGHSIGAQVGNFS